MPAIREGSAKFGTRLERNLVLVEAIAHDASCRYGRNRYTFGRNRRRVGIFPQASKYSSSNFLEFDFAWTCLVYCDFAWTSLVHCTTSLVLSLAKHLTKSEM